MRLSSEDHSRDSAGLTYVYPVVSRRAGGVSIGVNLNPDSTCNWSCAYCQVPNLKRGAGPTIDLALFETELVGLLDDLVHGDWLELRVPPERRRLGDVAFSGNGEPTTSRQLEAALEVTQRALERFELAGSLPVVLITNGSQVHKQRVQSALERLSGMTGEVWFKLDSGTVEGRRRLNGVALPTERVESNLVRASELCPTRLQTLLLAWEGVAPTQREQEAWIALVRRARERGARIRDVLLYGLEREPLGPLAERVSKLPASWLEAFAQLIRAELNLAVHVHP